MKHQCSELIYKQKYFVIGSFYNYLIIKLSLKSDFACEQPLIISLQEEIKFLSIIYVTCQINFSTIKPLEPTFHINLSPYIGLPHSISRITVHCNLKENMNIIHRPQNWVWGARGGKGGLDLQEYT